jgi:hypothetical protein
VVYYGSECSGAIFLGKNDGIEPFEAVVQKSFGLLGFVSNLGFDGPTGSFASNNYRSDGIGD